MTQIISPTRRNQKAIAFHKACIRQMEEHKGTQLTFSDPDARMMPHQAQDLKVCYNVQTATAHESHIITGFVVANHNNDMDQTHDTVERAHQNLDVEALAIIADKGCERAKDIENCLLDGFMSDEGLRYDRAERIVSPDYRSERIFDVQKAFQRAKEIRACLHTGVLLDCCQNPKLRVELQFQSVESRFIRHAQTARVPSPWGSRSSFRGIERTARFTEAAKPAAAVPLAARTEELHRREVRRACPGHALYPLGRRATARVHADQRTPLRHHQAL